MEYFDLIKGKGFVKKRGKWKRLRRGKWRRY
jgi:hypothetical protein